MSQGDRALKRENTRLQSEVARLSEVNAALEKKLLQKGKHIKKLNAIIIDKEAETEKCMNSYRLVKRELMLWASHNNVLGDTERAAQMPRMVASSSKGAGPSELPPRARMGRASKGELLANRLKCMRAASPSDDDRTVVGDNGNEQDVDADADSGGDDDDDAHLVGDSDGGEAEEYDDDDVDEAEDKEAAEGGSDDDDDDDAWHPTPGARVWAMWQQTKNRPTKNEARKVPSNSHLWHRGTVSAQNKDGTFNIEYDDGDKEKGVKSGFILPLEDEEDSAASDEPGNASTKAKAKAEARGTGTEPLGGPSSTAKKRSIAMREKSDAAKSPVAAAAALAGANAGAASSSKKRQRASGTPTAASSSVQPTSTASAAAPSTAGGKSTGAKSTGGASARAPDSSSAHDKKRVRWSAEEEAELRRLYLAATSSGWNSQGRWIRILEAGKGVFHERRSPQDLKDKARNLHLV